MQALRAPEPRVLRPQRLCCFNEFLAFIEILHRLSLQKTHEDYSARLFLLALSTFQKLMCIPVCIFIMMRSLISLSFMKYPSRLYDSLHA